MQEVLVGLLIRQCLEDLIITIDATGAQEKFDINSYKKTCMLNGYDDIDYLLNMKPEIEAYEKTI